MTRLAIILACLTTPATAETVCVPGADLAAAAKEQGMALTFEGFLADGATWRDACSRDRAAVERPEPEPGGHWATRDNEPDSRTDPEGHRDWQQDRDVQREEGTW